VVPSAFTINTKNTSSLHRMASITHLQSLVDVAATLDAADELAPFRVRFHHPQIDGRPALYFCGNSLGLQPDGTRQEVLQELDDWQRLGVEGHFSARSPWFSAHATVTQAMARIVGALPHEVVMMNSLTVNLHLMLVSFYRPTSERFRILLAGHEFPSDRYALETHVRSMGLDPTETLLELHPHPGSHTLTTEQICAAIADLGPSLAMVMFSGVHYYTGQYFNIPAITTAAHDVGAIAGFDLAHAAGNVNLQLHDWDVDYAVWCSYKYLNSGPGGVGGTFVHERHGNRTDLPRFGGWWGNAEATRFTMDHAFVPTVGADGWQLSNAPILPLAALRASLAIFDEAGMDVIGAKREALTGYLVDVLDAVLTGVGGVHIITPRNSAERGAQISLSFDHGGKDVFDALRSRGVIADWRTPSVIRLAPAPLYNSFADVAALGEHLQSSLAEARS